MSIKVVKEAIVYVVRLFSKFTCILQRIQNANYDLHTELEDFVALQVAREMGEKMSNR